MSATNHGSGAGPRDAAREEPFDRGTGADILVVDDNESDLITLEAALAPLGRKLVLVRSGIEALAKLLAQDFALVVIDVAMPDMSGFECAELIRQHPRSRETPILFVTGLSVQDRARLAGERSGTCDVLVKPIDPEVLRAKARVLLATALGGGTTTRQS